MKSFIFGASGFAKEVEFYIFESNNNPQTKLDIFAFVVNDSEYNAGNSINGIQIISESNYFNTFNKSELHNCIIAVGQPALKERIYNKINCESTLFPVIIHPTVIYDKRTLKIGKGSIICPGNLITVEIEIGDFVHLNINTTVGHECKIGNFSTISPGVQISGNVKISSNVFIGTGATILEKVEITANSIIGASALVNKTIEEPGTYVGMPVKKIK
jgi:sugar O-acyltransferase (sialic acid O-acetyltransferase NeuD family)